MVTLPSWYEFMIPLLKILSDGQVRPYRDLRDATASLTLDDEQRSVRLDSGQLKSENRIGWAASYLARVGALDRPSRGHYVITQIGHDLLTSHPGGISERDLRAYARPDDQWWISKVLATSAESKVAGEPIDASVDPTEQVEQGLARIHADVAAELLTRLHRNSPAFFEQAVVDLIMAMGYGGAEGRAIRTQLVNDKGIDGIVDQDALGLSRVYIQAKRYALDSSVSRPEIQAFVGALQGAQANQGVFITTARFSQGAIDYADAVHTRVVLINGARLTSLMIRYGVGVQVKQTIKIVEIDEDFFE
jgi:restriction system protein